MYSIWAANNTDNAYTVHQAPLFFVVRMRHNKKEKKRKKERKERKKKRSLMSDNKEALWTCLIIIKDHN